MSVKEIDLTSKIVLASTSPFRRELLLRLRIPFSVAAPDVDETALIGESAHERALRLALAKARAVAARFPAAVVIGSDQVAEMDGEHIGKPEEYANALAQLQRLRGRDANFHTGVAVVRPDGDEEATVVSTVVSFRSLSDREIRSYVEREPAYDCAGSAKIEGLGIALVQRIDTSDPTALIGLPLIALTEMLNRAGIAVL